MDLSAWPPLAQALLLALLAGTTIPLGGVLASLEHIHPRWLEQELRHSVIAFGGGALLAAVALVLVPEGSANLSMTASLAAFVAGGATFLILDRAIANRAGTLSQSLAMLLDFAPEALALGASLLTHNNTALLLAGLIALQNLPEGFNAFREIQSRTAARTGRLLGLFVLFALLGPLCAGLGAIFVADQPALLGVIMLFAAGGILYLIFQDIAPQVPLERHWAPSLGAVAGFALGLAGQLLLP